MLDVENLVVRYQQLQALRGVSLSVADGDLTALTGSNGAGKTTLLNSISGLVRVSEGDIRWERRSIRGNWPDVVCRLGIVQVPEGRKLFPRMTVEENLEIGAYAPAARVKTKESKGRVFAMFPLLGERRTQLAGSLSGGEQQMLALGRALMALPRLLMLDEPSLGLAPIAASEIFRIIEGLNKDGMTILLVSQEMLQTLSIARFGYLLENGALHLAAPADQLLADQRVKQSYLGM
jgi:branched-chain amino acid transport system ATP-binding protein